MPKGRRRSDPVKRFHERYTVDVVTGCWNWKSPWRKGRVTKYPGFYIAGRGRMVASNFALELAGKPLGLGEIACHHCDNPMCINPEHIYPGTFRSNAQDAIERGRSNPKPPHGLKSPETRARISAGQKRSWREKSRIDFTLEPVPLRLPPLT